MANLNIKVITGKTELGPAAREKIQPVLELSGIAEVAHRRDADLRLVLGGDGTAMTESRYGLTVPANDLPPIFGIKAGNSFSKGMLLNDVAHLDPDALLEAIKTSIAERFRYLHVILKNGQGETQEIFAFNDVNTFREQAQSAATRVMLAEQVISKRAMGDGILVCTPQGSTAYNLNAGGKVMTDMDLMQITGLNSSISSLVVEGDSRIQLETREPQKRPVRAESDGHIITSDVRSLDIALSDLYSILKFIKELPFRQKLIAEALRS